MGACGSSNSGGCSGGCSGGSSCSGGCGSAAATSAAGGSLVPPNGRSRERGRGQPRPAHVESLARRERNAPNTPPASWRVLRARDALARGQISLPTVSDRPRPALTPARPVKGVGILCGDGVKSGAGQRLEARSNVDVAKHSNRDGLLCAGLPTLGVSQNVAALLWAEVRDAGGFVLRPDASDPGAVHARKLGSGAPGSYLSAGSPRGGGSVSGIRPTIQYRQVSLVMEREFYEAYLDDLRKLHRRYRRAESDFDDRHYGLVSSVGDTLDTLWAAIKREKGDFGAYHDLITCWNLHKNDESRVRDYAFWPWGWGAPHKVHMWSCQMLYNYWLFIDYQWTPGSSVPSYAGECMGSGGFIRDLLLGAVDSNRADEACFLSFAYRSDGSSSEKLSEWCGVQGDLELGCAHQWAQESDISDCAGAAWDDWSPKWVEGLNCVTGTAGTTDCDKPEQRCPTADGRHHDFTVHLHAIRMAFDGYAVDHIMYLARMALDYGKWLDGLGRANESMAADAAADLISRYALRIMAERCRLYIHEIGHAWLQNSTKSLKYPGTHCEYNCCNDIAQTHWWCWVRADLGLPNDLYHAAGENDYSPSSDADYRELDPCSGDIKTSDHSRAYHYWRCVLRENGAAGYSPLSYCSTACVVGSPVDDEGHGNPTTFVYKQTNTTDPDGTPYGDCV